MRRLLAIGIAALAVPVAHAAAPPPVVALRHSPFGRILARADHQALYYWTVEKKAGGKIVCTGSCAKLWPPLLVRSAKAVPRTVAGIRGRFGVVRRPGGALQVTYNGLAVYTYVHERPDQVLCDNVDGWFVVRV
jgi:predicted lipoprotein with Yx(FWY)xxD motif